MNFHDDHQSGFHGVTHAQHRRMMRQITTTCSVAGLTEQTRRSVPQWWGHHGWESRIMWDVDKWHPIELGHMAIPTHLWKRGTDPRQEVVIPYAFLRRRNEGYTLLRAAFHFPAHLDDKDQQAANEQAFAGLGPRLRELIGDLKPDEATISGDTNRDMKLERNQTLMREALRGTGMKIMVPPKPTIRGIFRRRIDVFASTSPGGLTMLDWMKGYDHRGVRRVSLLHPKGDR